MCKHCQLRQLGLNNSGNLNLQTRISGIPVNFTTLTTIRNPVGFYDSFSNRMNVHNNMPCYHCCLNFIEICGRAMCCWAIANPACQYILRFQTFCSQGTKWTQPSCLCIMDPWITSLCPCVLSLPSSSCCANRAPVALCSVGARRDQHAATSNTEHKAHGQGRTVWPRRTLRCGACCGKRTDSAAHRFRGKLSCQAGTVSLVITRHT